MSDAYVPMPETCHPFYEAQAHGIRAHLELPAVVVAEPMQLSASFFEPGDSISMRASVVTRTMPVKKVAGPAPYVGDPMFSHRAYEWRVAVDDLGRHVAGEARLTEPMMRYA